MSQGGGKTVTNSEPWKASQPFLQDIMGQAQGIYGQQAPSNGMGPTTQNALGLIADRATQGSPLLSTAQNTVQNFAAGGNTNPYLDQMAQKAASTTRDYAMAPFTAAGRTGSAANAQYVTDSIGNVMNQMYGQQYNADQNRTLAAAQMAPGLANQDFMQLQQLLGVGQMQDQAPWNLLNNYSGAVSGFGGMGGTSTQQAPSQSIFPSLIGGALSTLPFLLSDERVKTDIVREGTTKHGIPTYSYSYKTPERFVGVMAQDVEQIIPEAVMTGADGFKRVNYSLLG